MIRSVIFALLLLMPVGAMAQTPETPQANPQPLKPEELDQLVAPIALYPDTLLAEVLMASAYPIDIIQAERWLQSHKNLKGEALQKEVAKQDWDDSIKSLVATPDVLAMMSEKLDWTEKLGDAVVAQQPDVMDAIQRLRAKAQANDKLKSTKQQTVTVNEVQGKQVIAIAPADPDTVYVPYYDPSVVYGSWPYPDYPPYYWPPPPYIGYGLLATGLAFGTSLRQATGPRIRSRGAAAIGGNRESTTGRPATEVNATSAAIAVNRFSIPAANPATDLVLAINLATGLALAPGPAAAETTSPAIVPIRGPRSPITARARGRAPKREVRTVRQARDRRIVPVAADNTRISAVVAAGQAGAAAGALWRVAAVAAVVVAAGAVRTLG